MSGYDDRDRAEEWIEDFLGSARFVDLASPGPVREYAREILAAFLRGAGVAPADLAEADMKAGLVGGVGGLDLPASVRAAAPDLCAAFLEEMQDRGRVSGGRMLGKHVRALREPFLASSSGRPAPIVRPAAKVGRNDPCPCGSGRKYKQCCLGLLGP